MRGPASGASLLAKRYLEGLLDSLGGPLKCDLVWPDSERHLARVTSFRNLDERLAGLKCLGLRLSIMFTVVLVLVYKGVVSYIFPFWKLKYPNFKFPRANGTMFFEDSYDIILWKILLEKFLATCCHAYVKSRSPNAAAGGAIFPTRLLHLFSGHSGTLFTNVQWLLMSHSYAECTSGGLFPQLLHWMSVWSLELGEKKDSFEETAAMSWHFGMGGEGDDGGILCSERVWLTRLTNHSSADFLYWHWKATDSA